MQTYPYDNVTVRESSGFCDGRLSYMHPSSTRAGKKKAKRVARFISTPPALEESKSFSNSTPIKSDHLVRPTCKSAEPQINNQIVNVHHSSSIPDICLYNCNNVSEFLVFHVPSAFDIVSRGTLPGLSLK